MILPAYDLLQKVRQQKPVVHHLTNWVTIYDCAQVVKTLGASPVMAHASEEVAEMTGIASALVLNIGTLTVSLVQSMEMAAAKANQKNIPVILDVCGAGATSLRDRKCFELLNNTRIDIIKGNASEIARIAGESVQTKGVDSMHVEGNLIGLARTLALGRKATVVVTGREDIVTDGRVTYRIRNGHPIMEHVVGTGCMAASVIGTFAAVEPNFTLASACGLVCYEVAAELAAEESHGPVDFKNKMFDHLFSLDRESVEIKQRVEG